MKMATNSKIIFKSHSSVFYQNPKENGILLKRGHNFSKPYCKFLYERDKSTNNKSSTNI